MVISPLRMSSFYFSMTPGARLYTVQIERTSFPNNQKIFLHPGAPEVNIWSFVVLILSVVVDFFRARTLRKAAVSHSSSAWHPTRNTSLTTC